MDEFMRQAKQRAAARHVTVSDVVNEALRESFTRPVPAARPFAMITSGAGGRVVHHEPAEFAQALEDEDRTRLR